MARGITLGGVAASVLLGLQIAAQPVAAYPVSSAVNSAATVGGDASSHQKSTCSAKQEAPRLNGLCVLNDVYSGYSAQLPDGYWVLGMTGTWVVPRISCPENILNDHPRTAVWVGEWGSWATLALKSQGGSEDAWLPQIGTVSRCSNGNAIYSAGWEMAADQGGYGNAAQLGMDCPGNKIYKLCAYTETGFPHHPKNTMKIHPGDSILASVGILTGNHPQPAGGRQVRSFQIYLDDQTTGIIADGYIRTAKGKGPVKVELDQIVKQGGVIVEDEPSCSIADYAELNCKHGDTFNGLAKFGKPIQITAYVAQWKQLRATVNEYVMQRGYLFNLVHHQLARNSTPSGSMTGPAGASWKVTWLRQY